MDKHILSVLVENKAGVLSKVTGLFSRRGFNIYSLAVGETDNPEFSRITIIAEGDERTIDQIMSQLDKLIPVIMVRRLDETECVQSELCLVKVAATKDTRSEIIQLVDIFRARIIDVSTKTLTIEITGSDSKVAGLLNIIAGFGIIELSRTGVVALERGEKNIYDTESDE